MMQQNKGNHENTKTRKRPMWFSSCVCAFVVASVFVAQGFSPADPPVVTKDDITRWMKDLSN